MKLKNLSALSSIETQEFKNEVSRFVKALRSEMGESLNPLAWEKNLRNAIPARVFKVGFPWSELADETTESEVSNTEVIARESSEDCLVQLQKNVKSLEDLHYRLQFMMGEIKDVVKMTINRKDDEI